MIEKLFVSVIRCWVYICISYMVYSGESWNKRFFILLVFLNNVNYIIVVV